jgi:hypothetical protein
MNVKELMEKLSGLPQEAPVFITTGKTNVGAFLMAELEDVILASSEVYGKAVCLSPMDDPDTSTRHTSPKRRG